MPHFERDDLLFHHLVTCRKYLDLRSSELTFREAQKATWKEAHFQSKRLWSPT
ncbi:hypothetical protein DES34_107299 [Brevibacillus brevis]|nr:hypothetical protein DES34_107299 [Brevibacillus brevis]VEF91457.1 Uncharacterised protein [Brevibacillus brevis]